MHTYANLTWVYVTFVWTDVVISIIQTSCDRPAFLAELMVRVELCLILTIMGFRRPSCIKPMMWVCDACVYGECGWVVCLCVCSV